MAIEEDPFNTLLSLEDSFYKEGYDLGVSDGARAGLVEGRLFGLEKGFEKYAAMGRLNGRAMVWAGTLLDTTSDLDRVDGVETRVDPKVASDRLSMDKQHPRSVHEREGRMPPFVASSRMETHVRTLYALTELGSLSTKNNEDVVSDFDDRLKRAEGKFKLIKRSVGESNHRDTANDLPPPDHEVMLGGSRSKEGDGNIEDIRSLRARR